MDLGQVTGLLSLGHGALRRRKPGGEVRLMKATGDSQLRALWAFSLLPLAAEWAIWGLLSTDDQGLSASGLFRKQRFGEVGRICVRLGGFSSTVPF